MSTTRCYLSFSSSRYEGNQRLPSSSEIMIMDEMIEKLAMAKPYELPNAVQRAFRVVRSPQFFLRIANKMDLATNDVDKQKYEALASNLVKTIEAIVETTTEQLNDRATIVETIVKAAAEPTSGEFYVPLSRERILAIRDEIKQVPEVDLDEGFLTTLDTWIMKSHQDGMDLMVQILQKVLQLYAGLQIQRALLKQQQQQQQQQKSLLKSDDNDNDENNNNSNNISKENDETSPSSSSSSSLVITLMDLLLMDTDQWDDTLQQQSKSNLLFIQKQIQQTLETVVLASLEMGSMAQQVQAEYLQELLQRVEEKIKLKN